jgi:cyanophycinase
VGYILLEGGAEFGGDMAIPDRRALELAGGLDVRISIIPAAAAPDNNHQRAGRNGMRWFQSLGATNVLVLPLIDKASANDPKVVAALPRSQVVYMLGGFPHYLGQTLSESAAWQAMLAAHEAGGIIAGSSAGAMVLCEYYYNPAAEEVVEGLGLIPGACIIPHHDTFGKTWVNRLTQLLPKTALIGIDEQTGMLNDGPHGMWQLYGKGEVTLYKGKLTERCPSGTPFDILHRYKSIVIT